MSTRKKCVSGTEETGAEHACVSVDHTGMVTTLRQHCDASILITSMEEFVTNQTLVMEIYVSRS